MENAFNQKCQTYPLGRGTHYNFLSIVLRKAHKIHDRILPTNFTIQLGHDVKHVSSLKFHYNNYFFEVQESSLVGFSNLSDPRTDLKFQKYFRSNLVRVTL